MSVPATPAECLAIAPEALEVANTYLQFQDIKKTSELLGIPTESVTQYLARREVKSYIDSVFLDYGFNNRFRLRAIMDELINRKLEEMEEAGISSSKDITELMQLSHKMTMDILDRQIKLEEIKAKTTIKNQTNVQINDGSGTNYQNLLTKLMTSPKK